SSSSRTGGGSGAAAATGPKAVDPAGLKCEPGKNGGATDTGVTASRIRLATTAVLDGPAKTLLEDSPKAMKAVVDKVNQKGGICGRLLDLRVVNDSFSPTTGLSSIRSFIDEGYFALPVVPSAEGLGSAILNGEISKAKIPVVGTDGMRKEQYGDPYVWPVASATVTAMRVMAKYAATARGAKTFAIVYDDKYKFGKEGKDAFIEQVRKLGGTMVDGATIGLNPDDTSYGSTIQQFNDRCQRGSACDMVALLLLPETAKKWLQGGAAFGGKYTAGAQTLFTDRFAQDCVLLRPGGECHGFAVWTGYNPPIGPLASKPGVADYVRDVRAVKPGIDVNNQFVEGAYLGMTVFVEALKRVGPNLTREGLKATMDSMTFEGDLSSALTWKPGQHAANVRSQSFSMTVSQGAFRGWSDEGTGFLLDPDFGG
ncbi:MAG: ABC transporter substrate-binding protein, partial [Actinomycetota bacterium]|nr:ABC transporter substrate-binding protein [Actinomycetota bacterium]